MSKLINGVGKTQEQLDEKNRIARDNINKWLDLQYSLIEKVLIDNNIGDEKLIKKVAEDIMQCGIIKI